MKKKSLIILAVILSTLLFSCVKENNSNSCNYTCDQQTIISADLYNTDPTDNVTINSLSVVDDCLRIIFSAGGCNGDTWELKLIDSEAIIKTNPPKRSLRLSLKNEELCLAYITKEVNFDICNLQLTGSEVYLYFDENNEILYTY